MFVFSEMKLLEVARRCGGCPDRLPDLAAAGARVVRQDTGRGAVVTEQEALQPRYIGDGRYSGILE